MCWQFDVIASAGESSVTRGGCMSDILFSRVVNLLQSARKPSQYRRARRLAERCSTSQQFALVDHFIAANRRVHGIV